MMHPNSLDILHQAVKRVLEARKLALAAAQMERRDAAERHLQMRSQILSPPKESDILLFTAVRPHLVSLLHRSEADVLACDAKIAEARKRVEASLKQKIVTQKLGARPK